jgi:hypothetical protein
MSNVFDDHVLPITCPKCGAQIEKTVAWLRENDELSCPCGTTIHFATDELLPVLEALEGAVQRLPRPAPDGGP